MAAILQATAGPASVHVKWLEVPARYPLQLQLLPTERTIPVAFSFITGPGNWDGALAGH
jgi:hypothetical protein